MKWCLAAGGGRPEDLDASAYSYDPSLGVPLGDDVTRDEWEGLRTLYVERAPLFLKTSLPGVDPACVRFVPHHVAHAASAHLAAGWDDCAVLVLDGRGERASHLAAHVRGRRLEPLAAQRLPDSLGLLYEELTEHLGFRRSSDEYKVMAMASYGRPSFLGELRELVRADREGGFRVEPVDWARFAPGLAAGAPFTAGAPPPPSSRPPGARFTAAHADLACSVQRPLEEVLLDLARGLHERTGERDLVMAGGVALN